MRYWPEPTPASFEWRAWADWLAREFARIAQTFTNPDPVWDDAEVNLDTARPGATSPPGFEQFRDSGAGSTGVFAYHFSPTQLEEVFFSKQLPHSFRQYSAEIRPHIHWSPKGTNTGTVRWGLEYTVANYDDAFPVTTTIYAQDAGSGTAYQHQIAVFTAIPATALEISTILKCRLFRDAAHANDTYNADAVALSLDFHIEKDSDGSEGEYIKRF